MNKQSLRIRLIALIIAPALFVGLVLNILHISLRYSELKQQLINLGNNIIAPLAISSSYQMDEQQLLRRLVRALYQRHPTIVDNLAIFDQQNRLFFQANSHHPLLALADNQLTNVKKWPLVVEQDGRLALYLPIYQAAQRHYFPLNHSLDKIQGYVVINLTTTTIKQQLYRESFISLVLLLFCLTIALLLALRLLHDVTEPINQMLATLAQLRKGRLSARVQGSMPGELNSLKYGLNSMAQALEDHRKQMQDNIDRATLDLRYTLEKVEQQNVELEQAKQRAQEAARIKAEFLANMSHELRTPLNSVIGFAQQTLKTPLSHIQRDYLQIIDRSANHLLSIINDVLDFSKLEAGKLAIKQIPFSLRTLVDDVMILLSPTAHQKELELTLSIDHQLADHFIGDPLHLKQILINLVNNAIKFTENGNVDILVNGRLPFHDNQLINLEFLVRDTGIGISEQQQSHLFQAFRQADTSISHQYGGTGLGLAICKKLVEQMGGRIAFHSKPQQGSTFWFTVQLPTQAIGQHYGPLRWKKLAYIETNQAAVQATLEIARTLNCQIVCANRLTELTIADYDALLLAIPVQLEAINLTTIKQELLYAQQCGLPIIIAAANASYMRLINQFSFPEHHYINKPISLNRLLPLLSEPSHQTAAEQTGKLDLIVMVVDDNPANLKLLAAMLEDRVSQVLLCQNGQQAIDYVEKTAHIDVILMDIQMPGLDGLQTSQAIRQLSQHQHTPIIAVTAYKTDQQADNLRQIGIDYCLDKPISEPALNQVLQHYCHTASDSTPNVPLTINQQVSFDWQQTLQACQGKADLAKELLTLLLAEFPTVKQQIHRALAGQHPDLVNTIHRLHGSSSYCGTQALTDLCYLLEKQLRDGASYATVEPELLELLDEMDKINNQIKQQLPQLTVS